MRELAKYIRYLGLPLFFLFPGFLTYQSLYSQCIVQGPFEIEDLSNNYFSLEISGALNDSLSASDQGVCGVVLNFTHDALADLFIQLISPAGQMVTLIGPTSSTPPHTDFSVWNVSFIPCAFPASPDPGFSAQWSNNQPWGVFGNYSGSYHPFEGCLEDFTLGTVNGTWTLFVQDGLPFYSGELIGFSLLFCDPSGIDCVSCEPDGGLLAFSELEFCQGDTIQLLPPPVYLNSDPPSEMDYDYKYLLVNDNKIEQVLGDSLIYLDFHGDFRVYGLSILRQDSSVLETLTEDYSWSQLTAVLNQSFPPFCGGLSLSFFEMTVHPSLDTVIELTYCHGDTIRFSDSLIFQEGVYRFENVTQFGCDSIVELVVFFENLQAELVGDSVLNCIDTIAFLNAGTSLFPAVYEFQWWTGEGLIVGDTDSLIIPAVHSGTYYFELIAGECRDTAVFVVSGSPDGPEFIIRASDINCASDSAFITVESDLELIWARWTGPGLADSLGFEMTVSEAGWYFVEVMDSDSCSRMDSILVLEDRSEPEFEIDTLFGQCVGDSIQLFHFSFDSLWTLEWSYEGISLPGEHPYVNEHGYYTASIIGTNGCPGVDSLWVDFLYGPPDISFASAPLNCNERDVLLIASTGFGGSLYHWQGPGGFTANVQQIFAPLPGVYFLEVISPRGCLLDTFYVVESLGNLPEIELSLSDESGCIGDSVQIIFESDFSDVQVLWTGPNGFLSNDEAPFVSEGGWYFVEVLTLGGCIALDSIFITDEIPLDEFSLLADTLSCNRLNGYVSVSGPEGWNFIWNGPGLIDFEGDSANVDLAGSYELTLSTEGSECSATLSVIVHADTALPLAEFTINDTITCHNESVSVNVELEAGHHYQVTGPGVLLQEAGFFTVESGGIYEVTAIGTNGCSRFFPVEVHADTSLAGYEVNVPFFGCGQDSVFLSLTNSDGLEALIWLGPDGFESNEFQTFIHSAGDYSVTIFGTNGCEASITFTVEEDLNTPSVNFAPYTHFDCNSDSVQLSILNPLTGFNYSWTTPDGRVTDGTSIIADLPGWYIVVAADNSGCSGSDSLYISEDITLPVIEVEWDSLTCLHPTANISVSGSSDYQYQWSGPDGFSSEEMSVSAGVPGLYSILITGPNGCDTASIVEIVADTIRPDLSVSGNPIIDCQNTMTELMASSNDPMVVFEWNLPDGTWINISTLNSPLSGLHTVTATAENGCISNDSILVILDTIPPRFEIFSGTITCEQATTEITIVPIDPVHSVRWPDGIADEDELVAVVSDGGLYPIEIIGENGCSAFVEVNIEEYLNGPEIEIEIGELDCDNLTRELSFIGSDSVNSVQWFGESGFLSDEYTLIVSEEGLFSLRAIGPNGCISESEIEVSLDSGIPDYWLNVTHINCTNNLAVVELELFGDAVFQFEGPGGFISSSNQFDTEIPGGYTLELISNSTGCSSTENFEITADTVKPEFSVVLTDALGCDGSPGQIAIEGFEGPEIAEFTWSGPLDGILTSPFEDTVLIGKPGLYSVLITNRNNGCQKEESVFVDEPAEIGPLEFVLIPADCRGNQTGSIEIIEIDGAAYPVHFEFSQQSAIVEGNTISNIQPGTHLLSITDAWGCKLDSTIVFSDPTFSIDLGPDISLDPGSSVEVESNVVPSGSNYIFSWNISPGCTDCSSLVFVVNEDFILKLVVVDTLTGCAAQDQIKISISRNPRVFVPNVFYPGSQAGNDVFRAHWNDFVVGVVSLKIFDRYGNMVFSVSNCLPVDCNWNGTINGQDAESGTYIYLIELEGTDGSRILESGDVLLLR